MSDVDRAAAEELRSTVGRLLFAAVHHMPLLAVEFVDMSGYAMLEKVMASSRSIMGFEVLKVMSFSLFTSPFSSRFN